MRRIALLTAVAVLAACGSSSSSGTGYLRVANLSPDLGPLDFCVRPTGGTYGSPVMASVPTPTGGSGSLGAAGLVAADPTSIEGGLAVSRYFSYTEGTYDVAIYQKDLLGASCANPLLTASSVSLGANEYKLVAAVGKTGAVGAGHALVTFTDEKTVSSSNVLIRFVNAGLATLDGSAFFALPAIDVGVTTASAYQPIFTNVVYPSKAATVAPVDANGYATLPAASFSGAVQLTVCPTGKTPSTVVPPQVCQSQAVPAGAITGGVVASAYVVGIAGFAPNSLLCGDNTTIPPVGGVTWPYSACTTNP
jgi:hypothetical protein